MVLTLDDIVASTVVLQAGESVWLVFLVALCGLVVFIVIALWRVLPLIHKPRVTLRPNQQAHPDHGRSDAKCFCQPRQWS